MLDDSKLSAEDRYTLDTILESIRYAEDRWSNVDDLIKYLTSEFVELYKKALSKLPENIVKELFRNTILNCLELDEVKNNEKLYSTFKQLLEIIK